MHEPLLTAIAEAFDGALVILDGEGVVVDWAASAERLYGVSAAEVIGRPFQERVTITEASPPAAELLEQAMSGAGVSGEALHTTASGSVRVRCSAFRLELEGGTRLALLVRDIGEHRRTEEALSQSERRLTQIIDFLPDPTIVLDREGRVAVWNQAMEQLTGTPATNVLGKGDYEHALPFYGERRPILIDLVMAANVDMEKRYDYVKEANGAIIAEVFLPNFHSGPTHLWGKATLLHDARGNIVGAIEAIRDITALKRAEADRLALQGELEHAMKMEAVGRLAGGVAHDFNNLLTGITGNLSLAMMDLPEAHPVQQALADAARAAEMAAAVTRQLLVFSRKQVIEPRVVELNERIAGMQRMLARLIGEDVQLQTTAGPELGSIRVDPGQVEQILMNLAVNARDAMPSGGRLHIETANVTVSAPRVLRHGQLPAGEYVALRVSDTGVGMPEEVLPHIFEPFFTTKPQGRGTGLGLATTYGAVKQWGGEIEVESQLGRGTTLTIYFPRLTGERAEPPDPTEAGTLPGGTETILLAEDDAVVHGFAANLLRRLGYHVLQAVDGTSALRVAAEYAGRIDLLLTDVVMPGLDGWQVAERLRATRPGLRTLYVSGYKDRVVARQHLEESLSFLGKPYAPRDLALQLREILARPSR